MSTSFFYMYTYLQKSIYAKCLALCTASFLYPIKAHVNKLDPSS